LLIKKLAKNSRNTLDTAEESTSNIWPSKSVSLTLS
jgi:hypothetical protein